MYEIVQYKLCINIIHVQVFLWSYENEICVNSSAQNFQVLCTEFIKLKIKFGPVQPAEILFCLSSFSFWKQKLF